MNRNIVIIGAGPAGLLLAHYLLLRGQYSIQIYERRSDPRLINASNKRTFPISLQERGRKAIRNVPGLEEAIASQSVFCQGTIIYQGNKKPRLIPRSHPILTIDRNRLVAILLQELIKTDTSNLVQIQFDCECVQVNQNHKSIILKPQEGEEFTVNYDILIGADGARSQIRDYLVQEHDLNCEQNHVQDAYKSVYLPRKNPKTGIELAPDKIHASNAGQNIRLLLVPQANDQLHGTFIFNPDNNPLENLTTKEEILQYFQEKFPTLGQLMLAEEAKEILHRPVSQVLSVSCDRFDQNQSILIIGDAAHAVSPSVGQGCNSALEDVYILGQLLNQYQDDWSQVLPQYSQQRIPDAHALQELSNYSFPRKKLLLLEFFLRLKIARILHQWLPQKFSLFVFDLILDTDLPYSQVLSLSQNWVNKVKRSMT
jgi:kynurenine 3-monooxygenase